MTSRDAFLALSLLPGIGPIRVRRLVERFGSPERVFGATARELESVSGIGGEFARLLHEWERHIDLGEEQRRIAEHGISLLTLDDEGYPQALREIHDPPFLLFVKGEILPRDEASIAVVGSRRMSHYGREQARKMSFQLARAGFTVISGLARGIDTAAHEAALAAGGRTIAVLGSGIGHLYPPENAALAGRIAENGALVSEFPVLYVPDKQSFPLRNRIVAGMSRALLVVEAPARSGALITANQALEAGRSVFAVPGPVDRPTSEGCHNLIRQGATLVTAAYQIVDDLASELNSFTLEFAPSPPAEHPSGNPGRHPGANSGGKPASAPSSAARPRPELSPEEARLLSELEAGELPLDQLAELAEVPVGRASGLLLGLEMKRLVKQLPGKYFVKLI